jgi:hypothetical protein
MSLSKQEIDVLIVRAGLSDVIQVFTGVIHVNPHERLPDGQLADTYTALAALLAFYGAERARAMKETCEREAISHSVVPGDEYEQGMRDAARAIAHSIAALPLP